jgi:hypothetical protein
MHSGIIDTAVTYPAVSLAPLWCASNFVDYLREMEPIFEKALNLCIRDPGEVV